MFFTFYIIGICFLHRIENMAFPTDWKEAAHMSEDNIENGMVQSLKMDFEDWKIKNPSFKPHFLRNAQKILCQVMNFLTKILNESEYEIIIRNTCFEFENIISDLQTHFIKYLLKYTFPSSTINSAPVMVPDNLILSSIFALETRITNCKFLRLIQFYLFSEHLNSFIRMAAKSTDQNVFKLFLRVCEINWDNIKDITELTAAFQHELRNLLLDLSFGETIGCNLLKGDLTKDSLYRSFLEMICFKYIYTWKIKPNTFKIDIKNILGIIPSTSLVYKKNKSIVTLEMEHLISLVDLPKIIIITAEWYETIMLKDVRLEIRGKTYARKNAEMKITHYGQRTVCKSENTAAWKIINESTHYDQIVSEQEVFYLMFEEYAL